MCLPMAAAATVAVHRNLCCRCWNTNKVRCDAAASSYSSHSHDVHTDATTLVCNYVRANTCLAMNGVCLELYVFGIKMKQNRIVRRFLNEQPSNEQTIFTVFVLVICLFCTVCYAMAVAVLAESIHIFRVVCNEL